MPRVGAGESSRGQPSRRFARAPDIHRVARPLVTMVVVLTVMLVGAAVYATVTRGAAESVEVSAAPGTRPSVVAGSSSQLVGRLSALGLHDTSADRNGNRVRLTLYGVPKGESAAALVSSVLDPGVFQIRPVVCAAPAFGGTAAGGSSASSGGAPVPGCHRRYRLSAANLDVGSSGRPRRHVGPDPGLADVPSTSSTAGAGATVLAPLAAGVRGPGPRVVLGPSVLTNSSIASATAEAGGSGGSATWSVVVQLNDQGTQVLQSDLSIFYGRYLAVDIDGVVTGDWFVSGGAAGPGQASVVAAEGLAEQRAVAVAAQLSHGPLLASLAVVG